MIFQATTRQGLQKAWLDSTRLAVDAGKEVYIPVEGIAHAIRITNMFPDCVFESIWDPTPQGLSSRGHMQFAEEVDFTPRLLFIVVTKP